MTKLCLQLRHGAAAIENKDFKWSKNVYLFVYLVYDRNPKQWFTRSLQDNLTIDIGADDDGIMESTRQPAQNTSAKYTIEISIVYLTILKKLFRKRGNALNTDIIRSVMTPSSSEVEAFKARTERDKAQALLLQSQTSAFELDRRVREREEERKDMELAYRKRELETEDLMKQIAVLDKLMENKSCTTEMIQQFEAKKRELMMKFL